MHQSQQDQRQTAAQEFMRSLDQLEMHMAISEAPIPETPIPEMLSSEPTHTEPAHAEPAHTEPAQLPATPSPSKAEPNSTSHRPITAQEWEDAVADIERLLTDWES